MEFVEVIEGSGIILECKVIGILEFNIIWFKDGESVIDVKRYKIWFDGEWVILKIMMIELDDEG